MVFVSSILNTFGITSLGIRGLNANPQSMDELIENYNFQQTEPPFTWEEFCAKRDEVQLTYALQEIRSRRTKELNETDWIELPYNRERIENLEEWLTYRQALRDIPSTITSSDIVWNISSNTKPTFKCEKFNNLTRPLILRKSV
jgi:hypothetical protein